MIRRSRLVWNLSKSLVWLWGKLWLRLRYEGVAQVPKTGPLLLVANHSSYLDPPLVGVGTPRWVAFLAQSGLARLWPLRWWLRQVGVTLIDRSAPSKEAIRLLTVVLQQGGCVCVFPEGTRSRDGGIGPWKHGVELLLRRSDAVVVPVGLDGPQRALPRGALLPRPRRCVVRFGAPWSRERALQPGGIEALRAEVAALARSPLRSQVGSGPGAIPADVRASAEAR